MKASIDLNTGLIIESQESADDKTMLDNAASYGYTNVKIVTVTDAEHDALIKARDDSRKTYVEYRAEAYSAKSYGEQLDMQYWDSVNGTTVWRDWVEGIKLQFPKV